MSGIQRFDGIYGVGYDAVASRPSLLRAARLVLGADALGAIPELVREAFAAAAHQPLLDVPCGALASLAHAGEVERTATVVGVDLSEPMLERAHRRVRRHQPSFAVELVRGDALDLPFADVSFGAALSINGLHCMPDQQAFVAEVARVLRPGATFALTTLVSTGTTASRAVNAAFRRGGVIPSEPPTSNQLLAMLHAAGFEGVVVEAGSGLVALRCVRASSG